MKYAAFFIISLFSVLTVFTLIGCDAFDSKENHDRSERRIKKEKDNEPLTYEQEKWLMFKEEAEASLRFNWAHILELRIKAKREGSSEEVKNQINSFESRYDQLDRRYENYNKKALPNLDSFIREYNRDMHALTKDLNYFRTNYQDNPKK